MLLKRTKIYLTALFFLFLTAIHLNGTGQDKIKVHYKIEDGLLSNMIYTILQDQKGFIWICTDNGVCRFDGQVFKRFSTANGLPDNDILNIAADGEDRIWMSTFNRNLCYIWHNEIHTKQNDSNLANLDFRSYLKLHAILNSNIVFNDEGMSMSYMTSVSGKVEKLVSNKKALDIGSFYIRFNTRQIDLYTHHHDSVCSYKLTFPPSTELKMYRAGLNEFLVVTPDGNYKGIVRDGKIKVTLINHNNYTRNSFFFSGNRLWSVDVNNAIFPLDSSMNPVLKEKFKIGRVTVIYFFIDRNGGYWIGTKGDGVYYIPNNSMSTFDADNGMHSDNTAFSYVSHEELFVLLVNRKIQAIKNNNIEFKSVDIPNRCKGRMNTLFVNDDFIVSGGDVGHLFSYSRKTGRRFCITDVGSVKDIEADYENNILLATSNHIYSFDLSAQKAFPITKKRQTCVKRINRNTIIAGSVNSIQCIHYPVGCNHIDSIRVIAESKLNNTTIADIQVCDAFIAVATVEAGVYLYNYKYNILQHFSVKDGLTDNNCKHIFIDSKQNVWISTSMGITKIVLGKLIHDFRVEKITTFNGLATNNINSVYQIGKNMYAASSKGVIQFAENLLETEKDNPEVYIPEISINGRNVKSDTKEITVQPDSNSLKIEFSGIDFKSFGNIRYFYRIRGFSDEWKESFSKSIVIDRLKPGKYIIEVHALSSNNVWSRYPARLTVHIIPYWWQHTFFKWLIAFLGIFVTFYITKYFLNRKYQRKLSDEALKKHITEVELKALKAQINPHFIFNTLNTIQYFIQNEENERADMYLNKMSKLIRTTLNFSNESSIALADEIEYLRTYLDLESLRFDDDFNYSIEAKCLPGLLSFKIPTMVLQPHVENAIRHGLKPVKTGLKQLRVRFYADDSYLVCEVEDNGIGRRKSAGINKGNIQIHTSQGEGLSYSKLEMYKQETGKDATIFVTDLYVNDIATGTLVTLKIEL